MSKKRISVTIQTKEVRYAIMKKTHATARVLQAAVKVNYELSSEMKSSEDEGILYDLNRAICLAIAGVKVELCEYLNAESTATDNLIDGDVEAGNAVVLSFDMPSNFDSASVPALGKGIHEYVVCLSCYSWYRDRYPDIAEACKADGEAALLKAKRALYKRLRPSRPEE